MKQNQQFNQAKPDAHEFCSFQFLAKLLIWMNALYVGAAGLTANDFSLWMLSLHVNLIWLEPALVMTVPFICSVSRLKWRYLWLLMLIAGFVCLATSYWVLNYLGFYNEWTWVRALLMGVCIALYCDWYTRFENKQDISPVLDAAELQTLGAAIRPHFFFNALNAVMSLIRVNPKVAENILQDTADLFRDVMNQGQHRLVTVNAELMTVHRYVRIEQARLDGRLKVKWQIDTGLSEALIPPFTLQPLVENAIRHGIEGLESGGEVKISVLRVEKDIRLSVVNPWNQDVVHRIDTRKKLHNGIALKNLEERLKLMYHNSANILMHRGEHQYVVTVRLPLEF